MKTISKFDISRGVSALMKQLLLTLLPVAKKKCTQDAWEKYLEVIDSRVRALNITRQEAIASFPFDYMEADDHARVMIEVGIGRRLEGAVAHYEADNQLECVRHVLLVLQSVCSILGWQDAVTYLEDQNTALFAMQQKKVS